MYYGVFVLFSLCKWSRVPVTWSRVPVPIVEQLFKYFLIFLQVLQSIGTNVQPHPEQPQPPHPPPLPQQHHSPSQPHIVSPHQPMPMSQSIGDQAMPPHMRNQQPHPHSEEPRGYFENRQMPNTPIESQSFQIPPQPPGPMPTQPSVPMPHPQFAHQTPPQRHQYPQERDQLGHMETVPPYQFQQPGTDTSGHAPRQPLQPLMPARREPQPLSLLEMIYRFRSKIRGLIRQSLVEQQQQQQQSRQIWR